MISKDIEEFLFGVTGVVEANSYERMCLWKENRDRGPNGRKWEDNNFGYGVHIGDMGENNPVFLSILTATIDGQKILFIDPTSVVVNHDMIKDWLIEHLPYAMDARGGGRYINKTDAMNFHNVFAPHLVKAFNDRLLNAA